jgi:chaperonin cofactor prefoldin
MMTQMQKDLADCLVRRDKLHESMFNLRERGGATKARVTTYNANVANWSERIDTLRQMIRGQP